MPFDLSAEVALLGSVVIGPSEWEGVHELIPSPDYFFLDSHQDIFSAIVDLKSKKIVVDGVTLTSELRTRGRLDGVGGLPYIDEIFNSVPGSSGAMHYAGIVVQKAVSRKIISAGERLMKMGFEGDIPAIELADLAGKEIYNIAAGISVANVATPIAEALQEVFEKLDASEGERLSGLPTGIVAMDDLTCGLQRGELIIIGARPSCGKTACAMGMAEMLSVDLQKPVMVFTLEMSKLQLCQRIMCSRSGVNMQKVRRNYLSSGERERLSESVGELSAAPIYIDDTAGISINEIRSRARKAKLKLGIELVIVDYIQLVEGRGDNREQQVSSVGRGLKALARELNIPVLALCQLNRSSETENRRPRSSDLRESGSLEQDADVVILIHREAVLHRGDQEWWDANPELRNLAELIVVKQRQGPCDTIKAIFLDDRVKFVDYCPAGV